jgi:hypothetical protein
LDRAISATARSSRADGGPAVTQASFSAVAASPNQALSSETMYLSKFDYQPRFEPPVMGPALIALMRRR